MDYIHVHTDNPCYSYYLAFTQLCPVLLTSSLHIVKDAHYVAFCCIYLGVRNFCLSNDCVHVGLMDFISSIFFQIFYVRNSLGNISLITGYRCIPLFVHFTLLRKQWRLTQISVFIHVPIDHAVFNKKQFGSCSVFADQASIYMCSLVIIPEVATFRETVKIWNLHHFMSIFIPQFSLGF